MTFAGLNRRLALAAATVAVLISGCGDDGTTVVVRSMPDTPDVSPGAMKGLWLRAGGETLRTDGGGEAKFGPLSGAVRICDLGTSPKPATKTQSCVEVTVEAGRRVELRFSDLGLTLED
jgi:hypothetical protein